LLISAFATGVLANEELFDTVSAINMESWTVVMSDLEGIGIKYMYIRLFQLVMCMSLSDSVQAHS